MAESDQSGLEDFYPYHSSDVGTGSAFTNVGNGNLAVQYRDLNAAGQGLSLSLVRTYNLSRAGVDGPIGKGWTLGVGGAPSSGFGRGPEIQATTSKLTFEDSDGTQHTFVKRSGSWQSPPGVNLVVTDEPAGSDRLYKVFRPDGVRYEIGFVQGAYRLSKVADRKGNQLTFSYSSGLLSTVTDSAGRTLTFTWTSGYVSRVTLQSGASSAAIDYAVNPIAGTLTSVTEFSGTTSARTTSFTYDTWLNAITDARGNRTTFAITNGRIDSLTDRAGKDWTFTYGVACGVESEAATAVTCLIDPPQGFQTTWLSDRGNLVEHRDAGDVDDDGNARINSRTYTWVDNRLRQMVDEVQNVREYDYNDLGQPTEIRISGQGERPLITKMEYQDVSTGVAQLTDVYAATKPAGNGSAEAPEERHWIFGYDASGNLITQTDPLGKPTTLSYFTRGLLKTVTNPKGKIVKYGNQNLSDGGYHASGQPTQVTDPTSLTTYFTYDLLGRVTQKTDRTGGVWSYEYDLRGNLLKDTNPLGKFSQRCYDANDNETLLIRPILQSDPSKPTPSCSLSGTDGYSIKKTYDPRDLLVESVTASKGHDGGSGVQIRKSTYSYEDDGQLAEILEPRSFNPSTGALLTDPAAQQRVTYLRYPNNRLKAFVDEEGNQTDIRHTPDGQLRIVIDPPSSMGQRHFMAYAYNKLGQVREISESGIGSPHVFEYNLHGEVIADSTPMGRTNHHSYDKVGRLISTLNAAGLETKRDYDDAGNLEEVDQPTGVRERSKVSYTYNYRDEIATESDPANSNHTIVYEYDGEGRQKFKKDKLGTQVQRHVEQKWFLDGRISERDAILYSSGSTSNTRRHRSIFGYDDQGSQSKIDTYINGVGPPSSPNLSSISATYTSAGELKTMSETIWPVTGNSVSKSSTFTYQQDGLLASRTIDGLRTDYTHWRNGLEHKTIPWGSQGEFASSYHPNGALSSLSMPNGVAATLDYDLADRIISKRFARVGDPMAVSLWNQIVYDDDDNRLSEMASQYGPDPILGYTTLAGKGEYKYDGAGRLIGAKHPFEPNTLPYVYDDAGNVINDGVSRFTYAQNRLTEKSNLVEANRKSTYAYDAIGNRYRETTSPSPGNIITTTYDAADHSVSISGGFGVSYGYDGLNRLARRLESEPQDELRLLFHDGLSDQIALETDASAVKTRYILDSTGQPIAQDVAAGRQYYVTDLRNNLTQLLAHAASGSDKSVKSVFSYDPYGRDKGSLTKVASGWDSRLRFQLAPRDPRSGLDAIGPRMFDPTTYRFIGIDSVVNASEGIDLQVDPLTGNRYLYAGCNPINLIDDGHEPKKLKSKSGNVRRAKCPGVRTVTEGLAAGARVVTAYAAGFVTGGSIAFVAGSFFLASGPLGWVVIGAAVVGGTIFALAEHKQVCQPRARRAFR